MLLTCGSSILNQKKEKTVNDQEKYVTFKADEFTRFLGSLSLSMDNINAQLSLGVDLDESGTMPMCPEPIEDAVVLRRQDVHASGALYAYGSSCLATADILDHLGIGSKDLREIADWAGRQADMARIAQRKLPTL